MSDEVHPKLLRAERIGWYAALASLPLLAGYLYIGIPLRLSDTTTPIPDSLPVNISGGAFAVAAILTWGCACYIVMRAPAGYVRGRPHWLTAILFFNIAAAIPFMLWFHGASQRTRTQAE